MLWGELDRETQALRPGDARRRSSPTPASPGLTLGGGIGWLQRKYGSTVRQPRLGATSSPPTGVVRRRARPRTPTCFWGLRGGGGNFGIVTEFEFRLHPVGPMVLAGPIFWPMSESPEVLRFYREWSAERPTS